LTDAHCHIRRGESRHFLCSPRDSEPEGGDVLFVGFHPWEFLPGAAHGAGLSPDDVERLRREILSGRAAGIGEIGLDRLKSRKIPAAMREAFAAQLSLAAELRCPVVLHGAKCWGEVVRECRRFAGTIPAFLFHGFSRSEGLLPEIQTLNGFVSVGPAILNDHAVNYRDMAKRLPEGMVLVESDATAMTAAATPSVGEVLAKLAELRQVPADALAAAVESHAERFRESDTAKIYGCHFSHKIV